MTLHLKSRGYPFRPRVLFSSFIVVGVGFPNCVLFQERTRQQKVPIVGLRGLTDVRLTRGLSGELLGG